METRQLMLFTANGGEATAMAERPAWWPEGGFGGDTDPPAETSGGLQDSHGHEVVVDPLGVPTTEDPRPLEGSLLRFLEGGSGSVGDDGVDPGDDGGDAGVAGDGEDSDSEPDTPGALEEFMQDLGLLEVRDALGVALGPSRGDTSGDADSHGGEPDPPAPTSPTSPRTRNLANAREAALNLPSEAAKKTAIRLKSGGWWEFHNAMQRIMTLLLKEMKPLGLEGAATFDPVAGIMLWREQRKAAAARKRAVAELYPHEQREPLPNLRPLQISGRHAAAAYGSLAAMLQNNSMQDKAHGFVGAVSAAFTSGDGDAVERKATLAAARSAGIDANDIVSADWCTLAFSPASYVAVDRTYNNVVVAVRGTVTGGDLLTDACSTSVPFLGGWAHAGMVASAWQVVKKQMGPAAAALAQNPGFGLVFTGHSMGAGVAAILTMLVRSGDADIIAAAEKEIEEVVKRGDAGSEGRESATRAMASARCHCFAAPSVCSMDLSVRAKEHTISVVAGKDVIPRLCYAAVRRLLRRLNQVAPSQPMMKAFSTLLGGRDKGYSPRAAARRRSIERRPTRTVAEDIVDPSPASPVSKDLPDEGAGPEPEGGRESGARLAPLHDFEQTPVTAARPPPVKTGGLARTVSDDLTTPASEARCQGHWEDLEGTQGLELRDHRAVDFLVQPGVVVHLRHLTSEDGPTAEVRHPTAFTEIPMSSRMMLDHVPSVYQAAIDAVIAKEEEAVRAKALRAAEREREVREFGPGGYGVYARAAARVERRARLARRRMKLDLEGSTPERNESAGGSPMGVQSPTNVPVKKAAGGSDDNPFVSGLARMGSLITRPFRSNSSTSSRRSSPGSRGGVDGVYSGRKSLGSESGSDDDDFFVGAANLRLGDEAALFARTEPPPMDGTLRPPSECGEEMEWGRMDGATPPNPFLRRVGSLFGKLKRDTKEMFSGGGEVEPSMEVLGGGGGDHPLAYQGYIDQALGR